VYPRRAGDDAGPCALQAVTLGSELRERGIGPHVIEQGTGTGTGTGTMQGRATARTRGRIAGQSGTGETHAGQRQMMPHRHEPGSKAATLRDLRRRTQCTRRAAQKIGGVARP
jgi:hypothetical protein